MVNFANALSLKFGASLAIKVRLFHLSLGRLGFELSKQLPMIMTRTGVIKTIANDN